METNQQDQTGDFGGSEIDSEVDKLVNIQIISNLISFKYNPY